MFGTKLSFSFVLGVFLSLVPSWVTDGKITDFDTEVLVDIPTKFGTHGIDVSHHNGAIDWSTVSNYNAHHSAVKFCFAKATEGIDFVDKRFEENWVGAKENNITLGAYHFYNPGIDPRLQALNFILNVKLTKGDFPPVLDFETDSRNKRRLLKDITTWVEIVEKHYGVKPIIYTNRYLFNKYIQSHFDGYPIWISQYNTQSLNNIDDEDLKFWQYTMKGSVAGVVSDVDFNVFLGEENEFKDLLIK